MKQCMFQCQKRHPRQSVGSQACHSPVALIVLLMSLKAIGRPLAPARWVIESSPQQRSTLETLWPGRHATIADGSRCATNRCTVVGFLPCATNRCTRMPHECVASQCLDKTCERQPWFVASRALLKFETICPRLNCSVSAQNIEHSEVTRFACYRLRGEQEAPGMRPENVEGFTQYLNSTYLVRCPSGVRAARLNARRTARLVARLTARLTARLHARHRARLVASLIACHVHVPVWSFFEPVLSQILSLM